MDCELGIYILLNIIVSVLILPVTSKVKTEIDRNKNHKIKISDVKNVSVAEVGNSIQNGNTNTSNSSEESTNLKRNSTQNIDNNIDKLTDNNETKSNVKQSNNSIQDTKKRFNRLTKNRGDIQESNDDEYPTTENTSTNKNTIILENTTNLRNSTKPNNIKTSTLPTNDRSMEVLANKTKPIKIIQFNKLFEEDTSIQIPISHIIFNWLEILKEDSIDNNY